MRTILDNGIIKQEIHSSSPHGIYVFRFHVFQLSESIFVIRPLETLFCPKENNEEEAFFTKFKYNNDAHSRTIDDQEEKVEYKDLLDYIYKNSHQMGNNLTSICVHAFYNNSNSISIYYLHPSGMLLKLIKYDKIGYKIDLYGSDGNIIDTI